MHLSTVAVRAGRQPDPTTGAIAEPIVLSTTFQREVDGSYATGYVYSREKAPNRAVLEEALAALDGGADAAAFSSGLAATAAVFQSLRPGDHVICPRAVYYGTTKQLSQIFGPWGLEFTVVDATNLDAVRGATRPNTRLIWIETPSNPTLAITDIAGVVAIAKSCGARVAVDNTWASPLGQRVLELGADIAMYSTTKYHGGHSDVLSGALVTRARDEFWERIRMVQSTVGAVAAPFDAWLVHRGIGSMPVRFIHQCQSAEAIANFLTGHDRVEVAHYPGLQSHPQFAVAVKQMRLFGAMVSVQVRGGAAEALEFAGRLRLFTRATSLGGIESLVEHRKSVEGPDSPTPDNLLRLSIGLEDVGDLITDLAEALGSNTR